MTCGGRGRSFTAIPALLLAVFVLLGGCGGYALPTAQERTAEVGLLLRRDYTDDPGKLRMIRHADLLLADNSVAGFHPADDALCGWRKVILNHPGQVRDEALMRRLSPQYLNPAVAADCTWNGRAHQKLVTYWLRLRVTPDQAQALCEERDKLARKPGEFRLWGKNCSSRAEELLVRAGILPPGLPGLDTPRALLRRARACYPDAVLEEGYFGLENGRPYLVALPQKGESR